MWVTLYTDASFCHETKAGGWATWCRHSEGRLFFSGSGLVADANEAELKAILHGMENALKELRGIEGFNIRSDSQTAVDIARYNGRIPRQPHLRKLRREIVELSREYRVWRQVRWTKGHTTTHNNTPGYLNDKVDKMAKRAMRQFRDGLRDPGDHDVDELDFYRDYFGADVVDGWGS